VDQVARSVAQAAIAERIVAAVPTILEEPSLHACHALAVEVPLQLGGQAQLAEQVPPRRSVELLAEDGLARIRRWPGLIRLSGDANRCPSELGRWGC
jgi:hypothetical protein